MDTGIRFAWMRSLGVLFAVLACPLALAQRPPEQFAVTGYRVDGTLAPAAGVEALLAPFTGPGKSLADLQAARDALEKALRAEGHSFAVVRLPPQTIAAGGVVTLSVMEYRVGRVTVEGARHHDEANVLRSLPALATDSVPAMGALEAQLLLANSNPVKRTSVVMETGTRDTIDFAVQIQDARPWRFATTLDNTGTPETGDLRFGVGFQHANLWNRDHVLSLQYMTAPHSDEDPQQLALPFEDDVRIWGASYLVPLPRLRGSLEIRGGEANVDSGVVAGVFAITGSGSVFGGRFLLNLPVRTALAQQVWMGYDSRRYDNDVQVSGGSEQLVPDYHVSPLTLGYQADARLARVDLRAALHVSHNLPSGSLSSAADFDAVRAGAARDYSIVGLDAGLHYGLGRGGELSLRLEGQYTHDLLVPGEQFGIGGAHSVRGLEERQLTADRGLFGSAEWQSPNLFPGARSSTVHVAAFIDGATGRTLNATGFERSSIDIASAGVGLRFGSRRSLSLQLDYGYLIDPDPDLNLQSGRVHGSFSWFF
jgi:hemolysin activation/secretion protein